MIGRRRFLSVALVGMAGCLHNEGNGEDDDAPSAEIAVEASTNEASLPTDSFELTVTNNGDEEYVRTSVGIAKVLDGEQRHIRPLTEHLEDFARITAEPGGSWSTRVSVDNTEPGDGPFAIPDSTDSSTGLGPGTYLVGPGRVDQDGADEESMAFELEAAAELEVVGDMPELEPVGEYEVERDGDVVTIEHEEYAEEYGGTVVFRRLGEDEVGDEVPSLILEQLLQVSSYRDAVSFFDEDVSEVRRKPAVSPGYYGTEDRFGFDGYIYEVVENPPDGVPI